MPIFYFQARISLYLLKGNRLFMEKIPNHVAIIPDGNRRWAKEHDLEPSQGHEEGAKNLEKLVRYALKRGIHSLSFWGSSLDNLKKRPLAEKRALLDIYSRYFKKLIESKDIYDDEVRINVIGRWEEQFPDSLVKIIKDGIERTKHFKKRMLNFMLAYSGDDEMLQAIRDITQKYGPGSKITETVIKENLMTRNIPAVDYVVRTGGEPHLSAGFMMWDIANAQLYFSPVNFPDFNEEKFGEALDEYASRQRRFGK